MINNLKQTDMTHTIKILVNLRQLMETYEIDSPEREGLRELMKKVATGLIK